MRWEERGAGDPGGLEEQSWVLFCRAQDSTLALCIPGRHCGHLWRTGSGHLPHLVLKSTGAKPLPETSTASAYSSGSLSVLNTSNHSKSPFSTISVRTLFIIVLFLKYFQPAAGWIWGYRSQRLWRLTVGCMCFSGDVSPRENAAPGRTKETAEVLNFLEILLISTAAFYSSCIMYFLN